MGKGPKLMCEKCGRVMQASEFYKTKRIDKYESGYYNECKKCATMHVNIFRPETVLHLFEELDYPFIEEKWMQVVEKYADKESATAVVGRYISAMHMVQYKDYRWSDSDAINEKYRKEKIQKMVAKNYTEEAIQIELNRNSKRLEELYFQHRSQEKIEKDFKGDIEKTLTATEATQMRLKWGKEYTPDEWIQLEKLYQDMMNSYDIQGASTKNSLILICKASLAANRSLALGDMDAFAKAYRGYDTLLKSSNLTAVQNKKKKEDEIDSVSQLAELCEKQGFIPKYYEEKPLDKVDLTIKDLQRYTRKLVLEDLNLEAMFENSLKEIEKDRKRENNVETDEDLFADEELFENENDEDLFAQEEEEEEDREELELEEDDEDDE